MPADGQTAYPLDLPIAVRGAIARYPEGHPVPDVVQVIDLDVGDAVAGTSEWFGDELIFTPDEPWREDADYLWTLRDPLDESRQPEFEIDPILQGEALFSTGVGLEVLNAGWAATGEICILTSRPLEAAFVGPELDSVRITIDDEEIELIERRVVSAEELGEDAYIAGLDGGLGGICAQPTSRSGATQVRIFLRNRAWLRDMFFAEPSELAAAARRGSP